MKISVIIPHYKREEQLALCLKALEKQIFPDNDYEVIIAGNVNQELIEGIALNIRCVVIDVESFERFPFAMLRNLGAQMADGELLMFLDCDIILSPDCLSNTYNMHKGGNILSFNLRRKLDKSNTIKTIDDVKRAKYSVDEREEACALFGVNYDDVQSLWLWVYSHTMCVKKTSFIELGGFWEELTGWGLEDSELAYRFMKNAIPIKCDNKSVCYHIWHEEKFDSKRKKQYDKNLMLFLEKYKDDELKGLKLCANWLDYKNVIKLNMDIKSGQRLSLILYEAYVKGQRNL
jgi:glycosyltransferase involved in cell wall biosynthesis